MKTIRYISPANGAMTYYTTKFDVVLDINGNPTGITHHSYTFTYNEPVVIEDDDDANELLLNNVFEEIEPTEE